ncbi:MAG: hypothetical protein J0H00_07135 [Burkholderiales bacterium]|nr:hypothetical protein [Burkholderiales bacterium]OJX09115.1 MAG: hypothetical protein BGO72_19625 [Burkholderiales bacterium 70-64]
MTDGARRSSQTSPADGLALLEEQRQAMLARDADRLEAANARLSAWIAACRQAPVEGAGAAAELAPLRPQLGAALEANALLAQRAAQQALRAFDALVAPEHTYTDRGLARANAPRRGAFSA